MKRYTIYVRHLAILTITLVVCLSFVGVGYAHLSDNLSIEGAASNSEIYVELTGQETNDPVGHWYDYHNPPIQGADEVIADGFTGRPERLCKDVGWTECELLDLDGDGLRETCNFKIHDAYPGYFGKLVLQVMNESIYDWVQLDSVEVIYNEDPTNPDYQYNFSSPNTMLPPWPHPDGFEVQWTNGAWNLPIKLPPGQTTHLGCDVHVLQEEQGWNKTYTFMIKFHFVGPIPS